jgi:hypothetical protein
MKKAFRLNKGKPQYHYIPLHALDGAVKVFEFGATKYNPFNYKRGQGLPDVSFIDSCLRHISAYNSGENLDPESGLHHIDHAIVNLIMLRDIQKIGKGKDYRFKE